MIGLMHRDPDLVLPQRSADRPNDRVDNRDNVTSLSSSYCSSSLTIPTAASNLLFCTPPFITIPDHYANGSFMQGDIMFDEDMSSSDKSRRLKRSQAHGLPHLLSFMQSDGSCGCILWSLYTGPVYVKENEHNSHLGIRVEVSDKVRQSLAELNGGVDALPDAIRMINVTDCNNWLVFEEGVGCCNDDHCGVSAPNMAEFFRHHGVDQMIQRVRKQWNLKAIAIKPSHQSDEGELVDVEQDPDDDDGNDMQDEDEEEYDMEDSKNYDLAQFSREQNQMPIVWGLTRPLVEQSKHYLSLSDEWSDDVEKLAKLM